MDVLVLLEAARRGEALAALGAGPGARLLVPHVLVLAERRVRRELLPAVVAVVLRR